MGQNATPSSTYWKETIRLHASDNARDDTISTNNIPAVDPTITGSNTRPNTGSNTLQPKQQLLFDLLVNHYQAILDHAQPEQLLVHLDGQGGTGKTFIIDSISQRLDAMASSHGLDSPVLRCAPTGVAAFLIAGRTINSVFRIPILPPHGRLDPLSATGRQHLQAVFKHIRYIIIDEKSMVSLTMLSFIHTRCGEVWPTKAHLPFSGINIVLSGDFYQLPPVARRALYDTSPGKKDIEAHGQFLYRQFRKTIILDTIMRQQGGAQARFRDALQRLRVGESTQNDWALFMTRCRVNLPAATQVAFSHAVRLCARRKDVAVINHQSIRDCLSPVILIRAKHDQPEWASVLTEDAGNLHSELPLCIGARVMLLHNIWTPQGLVNGTTGVVDNIIWHSSVANARIEMPVAVLVAIRDYSGPCLYTSSDMRAVIPIFPIVRDFFWNKTACSRIQFPLTLAWSITIHKSQGISLDQAVIQCERDFVPGLLYVAVSRVKTLEGLMFHAPLTFERLRGKDSKVSQLRNADVQRRNRQLVTQEL